LKSCSLEESIQAYRDAENKRNTRGINHINSRSKRRHFYTHNQRRSYANERRHSYAYRPDQLYAENERHNTRRPYANDRRRAYTNDTRSSPFKDTPRSYDNIIDNSHESTTNYPETKQHLPETETILDNEILPETSQYTITPAILYAEQKHHETTVEIDQQTPTTADETPQTKTLEQEPQPTMAIDSQNQTSIKEDIDSEHSMMNTSTNHAALEIIRRRAEIISIRKSKKTCRIAVQILQQEIKNDRVRYFIRWEHPTSDKRLENSWCWAEDVNDNLKRTFYTNQPRELTPEILSILYQSCNGEVISQ